MFVKAFLVFGLVYSAGRSSGRPSMCFFSMLQLSEYFEDTNGRSMSLG